MKFKTILSLFIFRGKKLNMGSACAHWMWHLNLAWTCGLVDPAVEVRQFYILRFSPKCALHSVSQQELTTAQGFAACLSASWLHHNLLLFSPPSLLSAKLLLSLLVLGAGAGRERWQRCSLFTHALMLHVCMLKQPRMGKNEPGGICPPLVGLDFLFPFSPLPVTGSGESAQVRTSRFRSSSHRR